MPLDFTIVTPEGERYRGSVESVVLPGSEGDFGVLAGHERFLSALRIGAAEIRGAAGSTYAALSDGFAEVDGAQIVVMVESCELAPDIDVARAEGARLRAERELARLRAGELEQHAFRIAEAALERAVVRLAVARRA